MKVCPKATSKCHLSSLKLRGPYGFGSFAELRIMKIKELPSKGLTRRETKDRATSQKAPNLTELFSNLFISQAEENLNAAKAEFIFFDLFWLKEIQTPYPSAVQTCRVFFPFLL